MKFPDDVEFKFNKSSKKVRLEFLEAINSFKFKVRYLAVEKKVIRSDELKGNKNSFYSYMIKLLLQYSQGSILEAKIRIDGSGDRSFRRSFVTYLRRQLNSTQKKVIKDCRLVDSKGNILVQMADMIAGSVRRTFGESKTDRLEYKRAFKKHIEDEWRFK